MKRTANRLTRLAACALGSTVLASACAADLRDAVTTGTIDFVTGTTTEVLGSLLDFSGASAEE